MKTRFQIQIQFRSGELDVVHACEPLKKEKRGYHSEKKTWSYIPSFEFRVKIYTYSSFFFIPGPQKG